MANKSQMYLCQFDLGPETYSFYSYSPLTLPDTTSLLKHYFSPSLVADDFTAYFIEDAETLKDEDNILLLIIPGASTCICLLAFWILPLNSWYLDSLHISTLNIYSSGKYL